MAVQLSVAVRNAMLDQIESVLAAETGTPVLRLLTGTQPATCATAESGTLVAEISLADNWMNDAATGAKELTATVTDSSANADGTIGYFRLVGNTTCHMQGSVSTSGADLNFDNNVITTGQSVSVTQFTLTAGNA